MPIKKEPPSKKTTIDVEAMLETAGRMAVSAILLRTNEGVDVNGVPFKPYSPGYIKRLQAAGQSTDVDLQVSGGLLKGVHVVETKVVNGMGTSIVAPDNKTSTTRRHLKPLKPEGKDEVAAFKKRQKTARKASKTKQALRELKGGTKEPRDPPAHNLVGRWHNEGMGNNPKREWFGLNKEEIAEIAEEIGGVAVKLK